MYHALFHTRTSPRKLGVQAARRIAISGIAIIWLCLTSSAVAQFRTSIQGVVTDPTGAVIPGATLTLTNLSTNETITRTSGGDGVYNFNALPADHFVLTAEKDGFQRKVLDQLQLIPEQPNGINIQLEPGAASTTVTVNGDHDHPPSTPKPPTLPVPSLTTKSSIFRYMNAIQPASSGWYLESRPMERSRAVAVGSRLRERRPERHRVAAAT